MPGPKLKPIRHSRLVPCSRRVLSQVCGVVCLLLTVFSPAARAQVFAESEVKAVFLFNLTKFIVWPEEIDGGQKPEFSIGILGQDPFGRHLDQVIRGETVKGRRIAIHHFQRPQEVQWQGIDLLFIGQEMLGHLADVRIAANRSGVLTVGDATGFCRAGGMVNLLTVDGRVKIEINLAEARRSGFVVSSHLLKLAVIITTGPEGQQ